MFVVFMCYMLGSHATTVSRHPTLYYPINNLFDKCNASHVGSTDVPLIYHYSDVIMGTMVSQITPLTIGYSTVYSVADQRKHQSATSLAFVREFHRWPVNSRHKWPVTRKMFTFDDVIMD